MSRYQPGEIVTATICLVISGLVNASDKPVAPPPGVALVDQSQPDPGSESAAAPTVVPPQTSQPKTTNEKEAAAANQSIVKGSEEPGFWKTFDQMHLHYTDAFVNSEGMGIARRITFDSPTLRQIYTDGRPHRIGKVQLIGLMAETPVVYEPTWVNPTRNSLKRSQKREPTVFERDAIAKLRAGQPHVWQKNDVPEPDSSTKLTTQISLQAPTKGPGGKLVAPLKATDGCIKCHEAKRGDVLGAFVYELHLQPPPDPNMAQLLKQLQAAQTQKATIDTQP